MNKINTETERLVIRLLEESDYASWFTQYENRFPSQHQYDEGKLDMSICSKEWFCDLVAKHHQMAEDDKVYVFGVFRKVDNAHLGFVDFSTIMREEFQWARFGYTIHNQFWRQGFGTDAHRHHLQFR